MKNTVFLTQTAHDLDLPYFARGIAASIKQDHINRTKGLPAAFWLQTRRGTGALVIDDVETLVSEGQGIFLLPGQAHELYPESDEWIVDWISLSGSAVEAFLAERTELTRSGVYTINDPAVLSQIIEQLVEAEQTENPLKNLTVSALVYNFLMHLCQQVAPSLSKTVAQTVNRLLPVLNHIDAHYNEAITLSDLAALLNVTPQHLCTLFRKIMNTRIFEYINLVRIKKSKEFLVAHSDLPIREVAHANGFEDVSYFCYIFKRIEKATPGDFRKRYVRA